jgi:hypothetical protein
MLREVGALLQCAVRRKVTRRPLEAWLAQLAERDDQPVAAAALPVGRRGSSSRLGRPMAGCLSRGRSPTRP